MRSLLDHPELGPSRDDLYPGCRRLVVAAGPWSNAVLEWLGSPLPLEITQEQVIYYSTPHLKEFDPARFPVWIWMDDPCYYGFPVMGEAATKVAQDAGGRPVTAEDVVFSWQLLRDHGRPNHRTYYSKVVKAEVLGERVVRFDFGASEDRELPLILALMPVLAKHAINPDTFEETSMTPLVGSGPYVVGKVDAGKSITFARNPDYWGKNLGVNRGTWNFDEIRVDYYRDQNSFHEAFKKGLFDLRKEDDPGRWQTGYDFPALRDGRVVKESFTSGLPKPTFNFVFNTRRAVFADIRVREAIALLFDFEWINRSIFFDLYRRSAGFFEGSELSASRRPADARERALLAPFPDAVRADVMDGTWAPARTDGSGRDRKVLHEALTLLNEAGWEVKDGRLINARSEPR